jgi:hypothetical protein
MRSFLLGLLVLISASSFSQQVARSMTSSAGLFVGFYDFRPPGYDASNTTKKYPLIIFLHGIGERGNGTTDLPNVCANGIPRNIYWGSTMTFTVNGTTESFLVLSPQLDTKYGGWVDGYVDAMLEYAKANLNYDPDRVYLTGLSAGGGGTWDYVSNRAGNAGIFAAIAPVCGSSYTASGMCYIAQAHLPVWAFHAVDDGTVPVSMTQNAISLINSCSPAPNPAPQVTYYPAGLGGHGIWYMSYDETHTYANPNLYEWFLSKRRSTNGNGVNQPPVVQLPNDISLVLPTNSTTLDASKSYDFDGTVVSYSWTQVSGPSTATISSPSSATTSVSNLVEGTYVFQVKITDDKGASSTGQIRVLEQSTYGADLAPICKAGDDFTSANSTVYLSGAGSYDPDGSIASYQWFQLSGPVTATITNGTTAFPTISNLIAGNYKFRLLVTDNLGKPADDTVAFTISGNAVVNLPPIAKIAGTTSITLPTNSTTLDGSGSLDNDGTVNAYQWSEVSGPNNATFGSATANSTTVNGLVAGTYTFQLQVTDNLGATGTTTVTVTVGAGTGNTPPVARITGATNITLPTNAVTFDGSSSSDNGGYIASFLWTQTAGPNTATVTTPTSMSTGFTGLVAGTYTFQLMVTDNLGSTGTTTATVTVSAGTGNAPPVARITGATNITLPTNTVTLDGSSSSDNGGYIASFLWSQTAGPNNATITLPTSMSSAFNGLVAGTYTFQLAVTDNLGATGTTTYTVTVGGSNSTNKAPIANAGNDFTTQYKDYAYLSGGGSYDPDGSIATWAWTQVSGPNTATIVSGNTMFPTINNMVAGTYTFRLTVTDNLGASASATVNVTLGGGTPPVANAGNDFSTSNNYAYLSGGASYDPNGTITGWAWTQVSGPNTATILAANGMFPTVQNLIIGSYTFRVTVTDNSGLSASDDVVLTVTAGGAATAALSTDVNAGSTRANNLAKEPSIYPNPATNQITVTFTNDFVGNYKFVVYDAKGKIVTQYNYSKQAGQVQQQLDISKLPAGMYYLETIYDGNQKAVIKKFVKL